MFNLKSFLVDTCQEEPCVVYSSNELLFATNKDVHTACVTEKQRGLSIFMTVPPKGCRTELNNTYPSLFVCALLPRNAYFLPVGAKLPRRLIPSILLLIQPLDFIFYKILSVLNIMTTVDSLFLPKAALLSIFLILKPLSIELLTPPSVDKRTACALMMLSHWSFSSQSRLVFFSYKWPLLFLRSPF